MCKVFEKTISQVVDENFVYARALHYLGIEFFETPDKKLKEICEERGLDRQKVIKSFYRFDSCPRLSFDDLAKYPIELLTEYLKHSHHIFIKEKLPYIVNLVKKWKREDSLKSLFPEFVEDFIKHIYEEEDTTFEYIHILSELKKGSSSAAFKFLTAFNDYSFKSEFEEHQNDDEFGAIRSMISSLNPLDIHERVLIQEIQAFDREMIYHAEIENGIFFPKAIVLEKEINKKIKILSTQN